MKSSDGKYHVKGVVCDLLIGSRAQVMHGTAYKTPGGLKKGDLLRNKRGIIVSRKKHASAKKDKRLEKYGYFTKKGQFGAIKKDVTKAKHKKRKGTRKRK